ncbi:hypothetical protein D3C86_1667300 [compost metagenome]
MGQNGVFDFVRVNVFPATDDHVLDTVDDIQKAVFIEVATIARVHPAVAQGLGSLFRLVPVAEHDAGTSDDDFAGASFWQLISFRIDDTHFAVGGWASGSFKLVQFLPFECVVIGW